MKNLNLKNIISERFKITSVTKNPDDAKHDVTVTGILYVDNLNQINKSHPDYYAIRRAILQQNPESIGKEITVQGDYARNASKSNTLRLKLYSKDLPSEFLKPIGVKSDQQLMARLRRDNIDQFGPYDEGGEFYDSLVPAPRKKQKKAKTQKNEEKGRQLIGVLRSLMDAKIEAESKDLDKIAALCDSAITKIISKKR